MAGIPPQPTVMVTGRRRGALRSVATELFAERSAPDDGLVAITTDRPAPSFVEALTARSGPFDRERLAVVDARGGENGDDVEAGWFRQVAAGAAPEPFDGTVSEGLAWLADDGVDRQHFLYDTLSVGDGLVDEDAVYDRAYRVAMTVGAREGLAVFALDVDGASPELVDNLAHLFDVHLELRANGERTELRWEGLLGASEGWVAAADTDFGVGGFR